MFDWLSSNLFLVRGDGTLSTPPVDAGLLPGITRQLVLELAAKLGMNVVEEAVGAHDLADFSGAFLTSSLIEIMPLRSITDEEGRKFTFSDAENMERLRRAYLETVSEAIAGP